MVNPTGQTQVGLKPQTIPRVRAEAGRVYVRLELVGLQAPSPIWDMELVLEGLYASVLASELAAAARKLD